MGPWHRPRAPFHGSLHIIWAMGVVGPNPERVPNVRTWLIVTIKRFGTTGQPPKIAIVAFATVVHHVMKLAQL